jgi:ethanolamine utilization protein EutA (predicted chaperonin)
MSGHRPTPEEIVMQGTAFAIAATTPDLGWVDSLRRRRAGRRARRALERELADYATASARDDLAALIAGHGVADSDAADVLVRQARRDLFRA